MYLNVPIIFTDIALQATQETGTASMGTGPREAGAVLHRPSQLLRTDR